jgi:GTP-binding protein HflX
MRLKGIVEGAVDHHGGGMAAIGGAGETHFEVRKRILNTREMKLKHMLEKLRNQRTLLRNKRQKLEYPVIAVVGYTNSGKDLIHIFRTPSKALTCDVIQCRHFINEFDILI